MTVQIDSIVYRISTKQVSGLMVYVVKTFWSAKGLHKGLSLQPIRRSMGMHHDFVKACKLAEVVETRIIEQLILQINQINQNEKFSV